MDPWPSFSLLLLVLVVVASTVFLCSGEKMRLIGYFGLIGTCLGVAVAICIRLMFTDPHVKLLVGHVWGGLLWFMCGHGRDIRCQGSFVNKKKNYKVMALEQRRNPYCSWATRWSHSL